MKSYYELKNAPDTLEVWAKNDKNDTYKFKKGSMIRIASNIVRFNRDDTK
jgi:hypothetical protein